MLEFFDIFLLLKKLFLPTIFLNVLKELTKFKAIFYLLFFDLKCRSTSLTTNFYSIRLKSKDPGKILYNFPIPKLC
jgi:hypothetical protein